MIRRSTNGIISNYFWYEVFFDWLKKTLMSAVKEIYIVIINEKKNEKSEKKETHVTTRMKFHDHSI